MVNNDFVLVEIWADILSDARMMSKQTNFFQNKFCAAVFTVMTFFFFFWGVVVVFLGFFFFLVVVASFHCKGSMLIQHLECKAWKQLRGIFSALFSINLLHVPITNILYNFMHFGCHFDENGGRRLVLKQGTIQTCLIKISSKVYYHV